MGIALFNFVSPILILIILNTLSGPQGSKSYEKITAAYGWGAVLSLLIAWIILPIIVIFWPSPIFETVQKCLFAFYVFCITATLSRDYEKIVKLKAEHFKKKFTWLDNFLNK